MRPPQLRRQKCVRFKACHLRPVAAARLARCRDQRREERVMAHHLRVPLDRYAEFPVRVLRRLDKAVQRPSCDSQGAGVGNALMVAGISGDEQNNHSILISGGDVNQQTQNEKNSDPPLHVNLPCPLAKSTVYPVIR